MSNDVLKILERQVERTDAEIVKRTQMIETLTHRIERKTAQRTEEEAKISELEADKVKLEQNITSLTNEG